MKYTHIVIKILLLLLFPLLYRGYFFLYSYAGATSDFRFWYLAILSLIVVVFFYGLLFQWERIQALIKHRHRLKLIPVNLVLSVLCLLLALAQVIFYLTQFSPENTVVSFLASMLTSNTVTPIFSLLSAILFLNSWQVREKEEV